MYVCVLFADSQPEAGFMSLSAERCPGPGVGEFVTHFEISRSALCLLPRQTWETTSVTSGK